MRRSLAGVILLAGLACGPGRQDEPEPPAAPRSDLEVSRAFLFAPLTEAQAGGYFVLHNHGATADTLVGVAVDWAAGAMLHESRVEGGRVRMTHRDRVPVPPADSLVLAPGGIHVMLTRLSRMPAPGDSVTWRLRFASGREVLVHAVVRPYGQEP